MMRLSTTIGLSKRLCSPCFSSQSVDDFNKRHTVPQVLHKFTTPLQLWVRSVGAQCRAMKMQLKADQQPHLCSVTQLSRTRIVESRHQGRFKKYLCNYT